MKRSTVRESLGDREEDVVLKKGTKPHGKVQIEIWINLSVKISYYQP